MDLLRGDLRGAVRDVDDVRVGELMRTVTVVAELFVDGALNGVCRGTGPAPAVAGPAPAVARTARASQIARVHAGLVTIPAISDIFLLQTLRALAMCRRMLRGRIEVVVGVLL